MKMVSILGGGVQSALNGVDIDKVLDIKSLSGIDRFKSGRFGQICQTFLSLFWHNYGIVAQI